MVVYYVDIYVGDIIYYHQRQREESTGVNLVQLVKRPWQIIIQF